MPDSRAKIWFAAFVLLVFCLGGAVGFRVGAQVTRARLGIDGPAGPGRGGPGRGGPGMFGRGPGGPPALPPNLVNRLTSELQLDAAQQEQVKKILEERRERFEQVHRDARDRFDREQRDLHEAIRAVLRADQQDRFTSFLSRGRGRGEGRR